MPPVPRERVSSRLRRVAASRPTQRPGCFDAQSRQQRAARPDSCAPDRRAPHQPRRPRPAWRRIHNRPATGREIGLQSISAARSGAPPPRFQSRQVTGQSCAGGRVRRIVWHERLGRIETDDLLGQPRRGILAAELGDGELAGADVDPGQAPASRSNWWHRRQKAVLPGGQERRIGDGAGGQDAGDGSLHQPASRRRQSARRWRPCGRRRAGAPDSD